MILRRIALICSVLIVPVAGAQDGVKAGDNPKAVLPTLRKPLLWLPSRHVQLL